MEFGDYIRSIRKEKKLSLKEVAKRGGLSHPYLSQMENNLRMPKPDMLKKLSNGLDVSYDDLMLKAGYIDEKLYQRKKELRNKLEDINAKPFQNTIEELPTSYRQNYSYVKEHIEKLTELEKRRLFLEIEESRIQLLVDLKHYTNKETIKEELSVLEEVEIDLLKNMGLTIEKE